SAHASRRGGRRRGPRAAGGDAGDAQTGIAPCRLRMAARMRACGSYTRRVRGHAGRHSQCRRTTMRLSYRSTRTPPAPAPAHPAPTRTRATAAPYLLACGLCALLAWPMAALAQSSPTPGSNPLFRDRFTADPAPLVVGERLYLYTGHDQARGD